MKRQRGRARPLYRYGAYRGRRGGSVRPALAVVCAAAGLALVLIRGLGIRFSGFLLLAAAAVLLLSWLLDRLDRGGERRWHILRRAFYGCLAVGLALLVGLEVHLCNRGRSDMTPLPADAVIVLGPGSTAQSRRCPCGPGWTRRWSTWSTGRTSRRCSPVAPATGRTSARPSACTST